MLKSAWTPGKDKNQHAIREAKALWNVKVSAYISDFIALKVMFNGRKSKFSEKPLLLHITAEDVAKFESNAVALYQVFENTIIPEIKNIIKLQDSYALDFSNKPKKEAKDEYKQVIESKMQWNKQAKEFINTIIEFKKLVNGLENKFIPEKTKIHEQFKGNPEKLIDILNNYNKSLLTYAVKILNNQVNVKKTSSIDTIFNKYSSNVLTRTWKGVKNLGTSLFGDKELSIIADYQTKCITSLGKIKSTLAGIESKITYPNSDAETLNLVEKLTLEHAMFVEMIKRIDHESIKLSDTNPAFRALFFRAKKDDKGNLINEDGQLVDEVGNIIDDKGRIISKNKDQIVADEEKVVVDEQKLNSAVSEKDIAQLENKLVKDEEKLVEDLSKQVEPKAEDLSKQVESKVEPIVEKEQESKKIQAPIAKKKSLKEQRQEEAIRKQRLSQEIEEVSDAIIDLKALQETILSTIFKAIPGQKRNEILNMLDEVISIYEDNFSKSKNMDLAQSIKEMYYHIVNEILPILNKSPLTSPQGYELFSKHIINELLVAEKQVKTAGILNNPLLGTPGFTLNKIKQIWSQDAALRNTVFRSLAPMREKIDDLLNRVEGMDQFTPEMFEEIADFIGKKNPDYVFDTEYNRRRDKNQGESFNKFIRDLRDSVTILKRNNDFRNQKSKSKH